MFIEDHRLSFRMSFLLSVSTLLIFMRFHSDYKYVPTGKKAHEICRVKVGGSRRRYLCKNHSEAGIYYALEFSHIFFLNHFSLRLLRLHN